MVDGEGLMSSLTDFTVTQLMCCLLFIQKNDQKNSLFCFLVIVDDQSNTDSQCFQHETPE